MANSYRKRASVKLLLVSAFSLIPIAVLVVVASREPSVPTIGMTVLLGALSGFLAGMATAHGWLS